MSGPAGTLALVGGEEWSDGGAVDRELLELSGGSRVVVLPTAAAYEQPAGVVARARAHYADLGAEVEVVAAYTRADASSPELVAAVAGAAFVYLPAGSAMHLLSVIKRTPLWEAMLAAYAGGAVVAAAGSSAAVLCDAMVDARGGGFGVGLGLVTEFALIPRYEQWSVEKARRTMLLAPASLVLVGIPEQTALLRGPAGWRIAGTGEVRLWRAGTAVGFDVLTTAVTDGVEPPES